MGLRIFYLDCGYLLGSFLFIGFGNVGVRMGLGYFFFIVVVIFSLCLWNIYNFKVLLRESFFFVVDL